MGHSLRQAEFFEGGVDLTVNNLAGKCFNTFLADTRSSQSLTATLFDFSRGQLGACVAQMTTQVSTAGPVTPGTAVTDTATVTGNKPLVTPSGTVTFFLCGPIATGACDTGGTNIGTGTLSGSGATATATSPTVNVSPALARGATASAQNGQVTSITRPRCPLRWRDRDQRVLHSGQDKHADGHDPR